jgi:glycosyltransferase involved in cell wall biosynthesis
LNKGKQLIVFGEDWGVFPSSTQYLISGLLKSGWEIIWINSIGMRKPAFEWFYIRRLGKKLYQYLFGKTQRSRISLPENLVVIHPMIIPLSDVPIVEKINRFILKKQLAQTVKKKRFINPVIWTSLPTALPYLTLWGNGPIVYFCGDDFSVLGTLPRPDLLAVEKQLSDRAALIFVVSDALSKKMPTHKTCYIDQGVDLDFFKRQYPRPKDLPEGKPIAGYFGSISDFWLDLDLLYQCASTLPHWNFVLLGPNTADLSRFKKLNNFFYLGFKKSFQDVPAYPAHWDASLMPFNKSQLTEAFNPLKLKEYLCCGKPIVSVDLPAMASSGDYVYIAKNAEDFIQGIEFSLNDKGHALRQNSVRNDSWDSRSLFVHEKLLAL